MRKIADSTVRRLSLYLRFLEEFEGRGVATVSSDALAQRGGTTSAQVRKDLSFFGSFGKRGLGYDVHELATTGRCARQTSDRISTHSQSRARGQTAARPAPSSLFPQARAADSTTDACHHVARNVPRL